MYVCMYACHGKDTLVLIQSHATFLTLFPNNTTVKISTYVNKMLLPQTSTMTK